ncbi:MAG: hypothetical protein AB1744_12235 [Candidatus Zixiibacteriota bacterium]
MPRLLTIALKMNFRHSLTGIPTYCYSREDVVCYFDITGPTAIANPAFPEKSGIAENRVNAVYPRRAAGTGCEYRGIESDDRAGPGTSSACRAERQRFFFLWRSARLRFLRLCVLIFNRLRFLPLGI